MMRSSVPIASAMFPADESDAIPSPRQVEYASIEWLTCGLQTVRSESAIAPESETGRLGVVGAVASVSPGMSCITAWFSCCALLRGATTMIAASASASVAEEFLFEKEGLITYGKLPLTARDSTARRARATATRDSAFDSVRSPHRPCLCS